MCDIDPRVKLSEIATERLSRMKALERLLALQILTLLADAHEQGVVHTKYFSEATWADSNIFYRWGVRVIYGIGTSVLEIDWIDVDPPFPRGGSTLGPRRASNPSVFEFEILPVLFWEKKRYNVRQLAALARQLHELVTQTADALARQIIVERIHLSGIARLHDAVRLTVHDGVTPASHLLDGNCDNRLNDRGGLLFGHEIAHAIACGLGLPDALRLTAHDGTTPSTHPFDRDSTVMIIGLGGTGSRLRDALTMTPANGSNRHCGELLQGTVDVTEPHRKLQRLNGLLFDGVYDADRSTSLTARLVALSSIIDPSGYDVWTLISDKVASRLAASCFTNEMDKDLDLHMSNVARFQISAYGAPDLRLQRDAVRIKLSHDAVPPAMHVDGTLWGAAGHDLPFSRGGRVGCSTDIFAREGACALEEAPSRTRPLTSTSNAARDVNPDLRLHSDAGRLTAWDFGAVDDRCRPGCADIDTDPDWCDEVFSPPRSTSPDRFHLDGQGWRDEEPCPPAFPAILGDRLPGVSMYIQ